MSKKSVIARQKKRQRMVEKFAQKRADLKASGDLEKLDQLPKNASPVRLRNRCSITGRPRGFIRTFGVSRLVFRDLASMGKIPGVKKASW